MSELQKKDEKIIYPDQLNIIIRTSVPGYQKIEYKPFMTIKDSNEKAVLFNPLIKLNQSTIDKIPKDYRIKEFFNKGLFQSLLNFNGATPAKNLLQATRNGYVDNNIKVTLNTIFPIGSVINIGKKPYAIGDVQWTTGDWKIEVKQKKEEVDLNKVTDPNLYMQLVREEIISGEEQLNQLLPSVLSGVNYSGPPVAQGIKSTTTIPEVKSIISDEVKTKEQLKSTAIVKSPKIIDKQATLEAPKQPTLEAPKQLTIEAPKQLTIEAPKQPTLEAPKQPTLEAPKQPTLEAPKQLLLKPTEERVEEITPEEELLYEDFKVDRPPNLKESDFFRNYFKNKNYFELIKNIFLDFSTDIQREIRKFYVITTSDIPKKGFMGLSKKAYDNLCDQTTIITSPSDGDCFFKAVADGINIYNYENQDSKIIYLNYGKTQLFTTKILREIVLLYIQNFLKNKITDFLDIAEVDVEVLNHDFKEAITNLQSELSSQNLDVTEDIYLDTVNNIYNINQNFLVYKPEKIPIKIDDYYKPFRILNFREIPEYIRSKNYWANSVAFEAICNTLKFSIIPIEKYSYTRKIGNRKTENRLKSLLINNDLIQDKCSKKTMFLYYSGNHYELIRFKYKTKESINIIGEGLGQEKKLKFRYYTIFKEKDLPPPIHILFLIYGSIYSKMDDISKKKFSIYNILMISMENSIKQILQAEIPNKTNEFVKYFDDYFPSDNKSIANLNLKPQLLQNNEENNNLQNEEGSDFIGGDNKYSRYGYPQYGYPQYGYPRYGYPQYGYPQYGYPRQSNILKKSDERGSSKIAYSIIIDMELHPGTSLTPEQINESKCNNKYNSIRKAFAEFTGRPYIIPPVYPNNTKKNREQVKNVGRKTRKNI